MAQRSKYNVSKNTASRTYEGTVFDSAMEMHYYRDIVIPGLKSGEIVSVEMQKPFELQPKFTYNGKTVRKVEYVADFVLAFADGTSQVVDVKGMADAVALLKRKMFWHRYPDLDYVWMTESKIDGGWLPYENVQAARKARRKERNLK